MRRRAHGQEGVLDYQKLDAALVAALDEIQRADERVLAVFIHAERPLGADEVAALEAMGVSGGVEGQRIVTATLSRLQVEALTDQPWVRYLRLSRRLRPLGSE